MSQEADMSAASPARQKGLEEANIRLDRVTQYERMRAQGVSRRRAARLVAGTAWQSLIRWAEAYAEGGFEALLPRTYERGRKPKQLSGFEADVARQLAVRMGSVEAAAQVLADSDYVRPEVVPHLRKLTPAVRRQIAPTKELQNLYRGPDAFRLGGYWQPRDLTYLDENGQKRELQPGDLFERDDMTVNFGWWVDWPWGGDPCADKFGCRLLRGQLLVQIDVASLRVLSFELIARRQDSYRMDDIWAWMGRGYRDIGMPRIGERLEGGVWAGSTVAGKKIKLKDGAEVLEGHTPRPVRIGGLQALGIRIIRSYQPTTKIIENRFNHHQSIQGLIPGQLGRKRGEMERENSLWMRCRNGIEDPRNHFLKQSEAVERIAQVFAWCNTNAVDGRVYKGVPDELWQRSVGERPLAIVPAERAWLFARERRELSIRRGLVKASVKGPEGTLHCFYSNPEVFARLGTGYPVIVYFDPYLPSAPAVIVDAKRGATVGQVLCTAEAVESVPQFSLVDETLRESGVLDRSGYNRRKAWSEAVRSEYRSIGLAGSKGTAVKSAVDGRGSAVQIERGTRQPAASAPTTEKKADQGRRNRVAASRPAQVEEISEERFSRRPLRPSDEAEELTDSRGIKRQITEVEYL